VNTTTIYPGAVSGNDPEDGLYCGANGHNGSPSRIAITSLPDSSKAVLAYYDGFTYRILSPGNIYSPYWNATAQVFEIQSFDARNLYLYGKDGIYSLSFVYAWVDAARVIGNSALYVLNLTSPLPVKLVLFEATKNNQTGLLTWQTATEENSDRFEIERSTDGASFTAFGQVKAAGNSTQPIDYTFTDQNPAPGINYYRLKEVDHDGSFHYSTIRTLLFDEAHNHAGLQVSPNPASNGALYINLADQANESVTLSLCDMTGRCVLSRVIHTYSGNNNVILDINTLPSGVYQLHAVINGQVLGCKVAVVK
jgi:hypothetical protein